MHLTNFLKIRVKKYPQGYCPEIQKRTWYGKSYWVHMESVSGTPNQPYYYSTMDMAVNETKKHFGWDLYHGSAMYP